MKKLILGALAALSLLAASPALALNCSSYPNTLTNGTTADANQVMANFNTIMACANSNLAHNGANSDITSLSTLSTPLSTSQGGTGQSTSIFSSNNTWGGTQLFNGALTINADEAHGAANVIGWTGRAQISSPADGYVLLQNNALTGFTGLRGGGNSASFPMWKRVGATWAARLADDSADTAISASLGTFSAKVTTVASASGGAGLILPHGAAPSAPVNGDLWTTTAGAFAQINGVTTPLGASSWVQIAQNVVSSGTTSAITGISASYNDLMLVVNTVSSAATTCTVQLGDATPTYTGNAAIFSSGLTICVGILKLDNYRNTIGATVPATYVTAGLGASPSVQGTPQGNNMIWNITGGVKALQVTVSAAFVSGTVTLYAR